MSLKLKALLLATTAVIATTAFSVASAQAFTDFINSAGGNTKIVSTPDGTGTKAHQVIKTPVGTLTCNTVDYNGTISEPSVEALTLTFEYTSCTFDGVATEFKSGSCNYVFVANGTLTVECSKSGVMKFSANGCTVKFAAQSKVSGPSSSPSSTPVPGIGYTNINSKTEITASMSLLLLGEAESCPEDNGVIVGEYTTGNVILTGQEDPGAGNMKAINMF